MWQLDKDDKSVVIDEKGRDVCCCSIDVKTLMKQKAGKYSKGDSFSTDNARLIAAAPDMLEALKYARTELRGNLMCGKMSECVRQGRQDTFNKIEAAIAKAEGDHA